MVGTIIHSAETYMLMSLFTAHTEPMFRGHCGSVNVSWEGLPGAPVGGTIDTCLIHAHALLLNSKTGGLQDLKRGFVAAELVEVSPFSKRGLLLQGWIHHNS